MGGETIEHIKNIKQWKDIIRNTEFLVERWKETPEMTMNYKRICKSWENFIDKQKDELQYYMKIYKTNDK